MASEREPRNSSGNNEEGGQIMVPIDWWLEALSNSNQPDKPAPISRKVRAERRVLRIADEIKAMGQIGEDAPERERRHAERLYGDLVLPTSQVLGDENSIPNPLVVARHYWYHYRPQMAEHDFEESVKGAERFRALCSDIGNRMADHSIEYGEAIKRYAAEQPNIHEYMADVPLSLRDVFRLAVAASFVVGMTWPVKKFGARPSYVFPLPADLQI